MKPQAIIRELVCSGQSTKKQQPMGTSVAMALAGKRRIRSRDQGLEAARSFSDRIPEQDSPAQMGVLYRPDVNGGLRCRVSLDTATCPTVGRLTSLRIHTRARGRDSPV